MPNPLLTVGELIDQSWEVYRARMNEFLTISGWLLVTAILFAIALAFYPSASKIALGETLTGLENFGVLLFALTTYIVTPIVSFWVYLSLAKGAAAHLSRKSVQPKELLREPKSLFFPTLLTSIMVILMVILAIVIGFAPPAILATLASLSKISAFVVMANILLVFGIFVSLFLSIKWVVYYFMAPYVTMLDTIPAKLALATSRQLIEGKFWSVLARITVPKIVFVIFGAFAMSIIAYMVGIVIDASAGLNLDIQLRIITMTQAIVPIVIAVAINPLIVISDVLLLKSLKSSV